MNAKRFFRLITAMLFLVWAFLACRMQKEEGEETFRSKVPVTVTGIEKGKMMDEEVIIATTAFQNKAIIKAPASGYLEEVIAVPGDPVSKSKPIFRLKTKEAAALASDSANPLKFSGLIPISSPSAGIIISSDHSKGDFVMEGDQLCSIALPGTFAFIMEVPFELSRFIETGKRYLVELPDGTKLEATLRSRLSSVTGASQTQRFILQPVQPVNLPENLVVKVHLVKKVIDDASFLPKSCLLSDEIMKNFWVMKVINDTLAVKVTVSKGLIQDDKVQITDPVFSPTDRFLSSGNYGLGDTAVIQITNK